MAIASDLRPGTTINESFRRGISRSFFKSRVWTKVHQAQPTTAGTSTLPAESAWAPSLEIGRHATDYIGADQL